MHAYQKRFATALALVTVLVVPGRALAQDAEVVIVEWHPSSDGRQYSDADGVLHPALRIDQHRGLRRGERDRSCLPALCVRARRGPECFSSSGGGPSRARCPAGALPDAAGHPRRSPGPNTESSSFRRRDARRIAAAARAALDARADDGWNRQPSDYILPSLPGYYRITPPQNATVTLTHYPSVQPFVLGHREQFLVSHPPPLTSALYADDFNEVKAVGRATSSVRTAEQTSIARRWAGVSTSTQGWRVWNDLVRDLARRFALSGVDTARAYALLNMSIHDGLLTSFNGKFLYGLWRPVTAIRAADQDNNAATEPDPTWLPLLATPPYPSYPGNHSCIGASAARALERVFGRNDISFSVTWTGTGGAADITRPYNGFRELADQEAKSRIYGGIHFEFETLASFGVCTRVADYAVDNYLRARFPSR